MIVPIVAGFYRSEDALPNEQNKWRHFNARKRKGILGVVGLCIGMRYRVMDGQIGNLRDWGVHTAATVLLRGVDLHEEDEDVVKTSTEPELTLKHMPRHLIVESDIPLETQCEGLPKNHLPMKRGIIYLGFV